jgi:hypothetical protein
MAHLHKICRSFQVRIELAISKEWKRLGLAVKRLPDSLRLRRMIDWCDASVVRPHPAPQLNFEPANPAL